jgi:hemolysin activation/secretion protein
VSHKACNSLVPSAALAAALAAVALGAAPACAVDEPTLSATIVDGSSVYTPTQLFAAHRDQLGRPINSASTAAIVAQIEALYVRDGYSRPEFHLDDDRAGNGILRIQVFEAQITRVVFSGDAGPYAARLEELASDLSLRVPLRAADLQTALQTMRQLPGLTVRATTQRDESRPNAHALTVATQYQPFDATLRLSNRGTRKIGPMFASSEVVANSMLGLRERIGLFALRSTDTDEYRSGGLFFDMERALGPAAATTVAWSARFDWDDLDPSEELRVAEVGGRIGGSIGSSSRYVAGVKVRRGLSEDFFTTQLHFIGLLQLTQRWSARLDAFGQQSAYVLPDIERYKLGGERFGRGFEISDVAGDRGLGGKVELRRELSSPAAAVGRTSLYGFYDYAAAWKQDQPGRESAASAGVGLAMDYWRLSGCIEVTHDAKVFAEVRLKL